MTDADKNHADTYTEEFTQDLSGTPRIVRHVAENGHPILNKDLVLKYARARLRAAQALNQEDTKKPSAQQAKDAWGLNELEKNLTAYFSTAQDKIAEADFQQAKDKLAQDKQEANILLMRAERWQSDPTVSKDMILAHQKEAKLMLQLAEKEFNTAFDEYYQFNTEKLKKINRLLVHYVEPEAKKTDAVIKKINTKAHHLRAKEARPIQENHYSAEGFAVTSSHIPEGELTNSQRQLYQEIYSEQAPTSRLYTNPSTIRDKFQVGQANALRTEIKVNGKVLFSGHRHGSPSVLKIENEAERQYRTMQNVRQTMALAAKEKLSALAKEQQALSAKLQSGQRLTTFEQTKFEEINDIFSGKKPLPLDMSTISLLSPVADDNPLITKKIDDPMKQYRQVNDSRLAYWSLQGREIELDLPGSESTTKVKLNSTFMTVGVNAVRGVGTLEAQALVQRVNNRGLNNLITGFVDTLKMGDGLAHNSTMATMVMTVESDKNIQKHLAKIEKYDHKKLQNAYQTLEASNESIHMLNIQLAQVKQQLAETNPAMKQDQEHLKGELKALKVVMKAVGKERSQAKKIINKEESKLDVDYKNLAIARKKAYVKAIPALQEKLNEIQGNPIREDLKTDQNFQKMRLLVDTLDTYYNQPQPGIKRLIKQKIASKEKHKLMKKMEKETDPDKKMELSEKVKDIQEKIDNLNSGNYQFQARFALLTKHMDNFVEWFCKSGEDRTGLLNEHIEAYCIFIEKHGYPPRFGNAEDDKKFHQIMPRVHNGAPNRETNGANDDAPALKVSDEDFKVTSVSYYTDKRLANMAPISSKLKDVAPVQDILLEVKSAATVSALKDIVKYQEKKPNTLPTFERDVKEARAKRRQTLAVEPEKEIAKKDTAKKDRRKSGPT